MVIRYSLLHKAVTEEEKKQLPHMLKLFQDRAEKRKVKEGFVQFDPDVVTVDIQRWQFAKRRNPNIKPIEQYKTHEELHRAMSGFLSEEEINLQEEEQTSTGTVELFTLPGGYVVYEASTPQALSKLSKGSHWCVKNVSTAKTYLDDRGNFQVVHKNNEPLVAITMEEVWYFTDYELRDGQNYSPQQSTPYVLKQDFDAINKVLQKLQKPKISVKSRNREDLVLVNNYNEIQDRVDKALLKGNSTELKRALLNLRDFPINIPAGTVMKGDLDLRRTNIRRLPEGLTIEGNLSLYGCTGLTSLPENLSVPNGYLDLSGCKGLTKLPENLSVPNGNLSLSSCTGLTKLPENLSVPNGYLDLRFCKGLTSLPENLSVPKGNLYISYCTGLTSLPENLSVPKGNLYISYCTGLTSLPENLSVPNGSLYLNGCTGLTSLPENLSVPNGYLSLYECTGLTKLPENLSVPNGDLDLGVCTGLTKLPENLSVPNGYLNLSSCTGLTKLPENLSVGGNIYGINEHTGKSWQQEYIEMKAKRKSSSLKKLKVKESL